MNGHNGDEEVPDHLYDRLPEHLMTTDEKGRKVPDYLKMILMCEPRLTLTRRPADQQQRSTLNHSHYPKHLLLMLPICLRDSVTR